MKKRIAIAASLLVVILLAVFFLFRPSKKLNTTEFAENFIRDFATYQMSDTANYNDKIDRYVEVGYHSDFKDAFSLPDQRFVKGDERKNYSRCLSTTAKVLDEKDQKATVAVSYTAEKTDAPMRPGKFTEQKNAVIVIKKAPKGLYVTNLTFSVQE